MGYYHCHNHRMIQKKGASESTRNSAKRRRVKDLFELQPQMFRHPVLGAMAATWRLGHGPGAFKISHIYFPSKRNLETVDKPINRVNHGALPTMAIPK